MNKQIFTGLGIILIFYAASWLFNNFSSWAGIALGILNIILIINLIKNLINKNNEKSN